MEDSDSDFDLESRLANAISNVSAVRESFNPQKRKRRKIREQKVPGPSRTVARILPYLLPPASKPPRFRGDADLELIRNHCDAGYGYPQNTGQRSGRPKSVSISYDMDTDEFYQFSVSLFPKLHGKVVSLFKMDKQRRLIKVVPSLPATLRDKSYAGVTFFKGDEHTEDHEPVVGNPNPLQNNAELTSDSDLEELSFETWAKRRQSKSMKRSRQRETHHVETAMVSDVLTTASRHDSVESSPIHSKPRVKIEVVNVSDEEPVTQEDSVDSSHLCTQESIAERRAIIALQDQAFEEALAEDRKRAQMEDEKKLQLQQQQQILKQIHEDSLRIIGEEPVGGVTVKVRAEGHVLGQRRFRVTSDVRVLMAYIHTLRGSQWFSVKIPAITHLMYSNSEGVTLHQIGVTSPTIVDVNFNAEPRVEPLPAATLPVLDTEKHDETDTVFDDTNTPTISFRRSSTRRAASIARQQVREWTTGTSASLFNHDSVNVTYSDLISSLYDTIDLNEDSEREDEAGLPEESGISVEEILAVHASKSITDEIQCLKVCRNKDALWRHSLRCFLRKSFSIHKTLKIEFLNEAGVDEGGLRREYLEILLRMITSSSLLCETAKGHELSKDCVAESEGQYMAIGRMIALIIFQGGPAPRIFSHHFVRYGINGIEDADFDTVHDSKCREVIEKIVKAPSISSLNLDDDVLECMEVAGVRLTFNADNADRIIRGLITKNSYLRDHKVALDQFWEGAEELGLRSLLKRYPEKMEGLLCFSCGKPTPLTAESFVEMLTVTPYGESGSNSRINSEEVFMNFESFLYDVQDGKCSYGSGTLLQLGDVFQFITGLTSIPPAGLGTFVKVEFTDRKCYPTASTCALHIVLPLHLKEYRQLKATLIESVISGPGFGVV